MLFVVMAVLAVASVAMARYIQDSHIGRGLRAVRDSEEAAECSGVPTLRIKLVACTVMGALMGVAGAPMPMYLIWHVRYQQDEAHQWLRAQLDARRRLQALSVSRVTFEPLTRAQVQAYVATGEPLGKAGAYAIQGRAAMHVTRIAGSYSGIMGLPMHETAVLLRNAGLLP